MNQVAKIDPVADGSWTEKLAGTNVNPTTFLATDYLNHFNEVIMLVEMVPDMPDMIEEVLAWEPKTYKQHFADSGLPEGDIAVEAYDFGPDDIRSQFEALVVCMNGNIFKTQNRLRDVDPEAPDAALGEDVRNSVEKFHRLVEMISTVINGGTVKATPEESEPPSAQDEIDALFDD